MEKMKCCIIGTFYKGSLGYQNVLDTSFSKWGNLGLKKVLQKDVKTYIFRFDSLREKANVLSRGTWYFRGLPILVTDWGSDVTDKPIVTGRIRV